MIECNLAFVPLNAGTYLFSYAVHNRDSTRTYDYHDRLYEVNIYCGEKIKAVGVVQISPQWKIKT